MENQIVTGTNKVEDLSQGIYWQFLDDVKGHFDTLAAQNVAIFQADVDNLFDIYLDNIDPIFRQRYNCNSCRHFVERYGNLVFVNTDGTIQSAIWAEEVHPFFEKSFEALRKAVESAPIRRAFVSSYRTLGEPVTGEYRHLHVVLPNEFLNKSRIDTAGQVMAEKIEDFGMLKRSISKYTSDVVEQAVRILKASSLYRSEKVLGVAQWLQSLHVELNKTKNERIKDNMLWLAVATAPAGFCHVNSSMIGTLLDDIAEGYEFDAIKARFDAKMNPTKYQRPQAAPTEGNIKRAEEIFLKLGIASSLERRFATLDDIHALWKPVVEESEAEEKPVGLFAHLTPKKTKEEIRVKELDVPTQVITWDKFQRTVLPEAKKLEVYLQTFRDYPFAAIVTANNVDAEPIISWDNKEKRNPCTHYTYARGMSAGHWNLHTSEYTEVTAVAHQPSMWQEGFVHEGKAVFFIINGCKDTAYQYEGMGHGNALFPENLRGELREVRSTIEAYSRTAPIHGYEEASACGIRLQENVQWNFEVRVTTKEGMRKYKIDRWD